MAYTFDENIVSCLHKDARGFRPGEWWWSEWNNASNDEKQRIWDALGDELAAEMEYERKRQEAAVAAFEADIAKLIEAGAPDRATAIRWFVQSMDLDEIDLWYGGSYICYELDLPYAMAEIFTEACNYCLDHMFEEEEQ